MPLIFTYIRGKCRDGDGDRQDNAGGKKKFQDLCSVVAIAAAYVDATYLHKELECHAFANTSNFDKQW